MLFGKMHLRMAFLAHVPVAVCFHDLNRSDVSVVWCLIMTPVLHPTQ
jgi:hypothetical protein